MTVRVGINGFGRIGRSFVRAMLARGGDAGIEVAAVNDPMGDNHTLAFLLGHDSVGGMLPNEVKETANGFSVDGREIRKFDSMDPAEIPWGDQGVEVVIESTGLFTAREKAAAHLKGGAEKVIISAPSGDADVTICLGVNDPAYDPVEHKVISNASCTTNCIAPLAKVLDDRFGIERGFMLTVHAYTSDQSLQDMAKASRKGKPDLRRMRAAALSIIPSSTGAARALGQVLPSLDGKLDGAALRVPTATGSITDLSVTPVSYTHLDVYKRQPGTSRPASGRPTTVSSTPTATTRSGRRSWSPCSPSGRVRSAAWWRCGSSRPSCGSAWCCSSGASAAPPVARPRSGSA